MSLFTPLRVVAFLLLGGCHLKTQTATKVQTVETVTTGVDGSVSTDHFNMSQHFPILLRCHYWTPGERYGGASRPFDLKVQMRRATQNSKIQYDLYADVIHQGNLVRVSDKLTELGNKVGDFTLILRNRPAFVYRRNSPTGFSYFAWQGLDFRSLRCQEGSKLSAQSPRPGDQLVISALKGNTFIQLAVTGDLHITEQGSEKMMSNSQPGGHTMADTSIKGAPVFNGNNELVGFVDEYNPEVALGIKIQSIHDPVYGPSLNDVVAQKNWAPAPPRPDDGVMSPRFIALCGACPDTFIKRVCASVGARTRDVAPKH